MTSLNDDPINSTTLDLIRSATSTRFDAIRYALDKDYTNSNTAKSTSLSTAALLASSQAFYSKIAEEGTEKKVFPNKTEKNVLNMTQNSSRLSIIQSAFDMFMQLDLDGDRMVTKHDLQQGLGRLGASLQFTNEEFEEVFDIADTTKTQKLTFSEFYAIYACMMLFKHCFGESDYITQAQAALALREAGIEISRDQLEHMFEHASGTNPHIAFPNFLQIYLHSPRSEFDLFLHSWYKSGRSNFLQHRQHVEISAWHDFIAGTAAGVALTLVGHPFDTIRTRLQTNPQFKGAIDCVLQTLRKEGPLAVYKGMSGPMLAIPIINAIVFACYGQAREVLTALKGIRDTDNGVAPLADGKQASLSLAEIGIAGAYAGLVNCIVVTPIELIRIRLQTQYSTSAAAFKGPIDCAMHILRANGVKGLFRGMAATIYREIPGYAGQFVAYEWFKRAFMRIGNREEFELRAWELMSSGGMAGMAGWIASYPCDYIKAQIMAEPWNKKSRFKKHPFLFDGGFFDVLNKTLKKQGFGQLWKGFGVCMLRAWPANAAGFLAYESVLGLIRHTPTSPKAL